MATSVITKGQPGSRARFRDSYLLHKLHSLSGIFPIGFYMIQHLVANSYALGPDGEKKFNVVLGVFANLPFLPLVEIAVLAIPILFHAIYGLMIAAEMQGPGGNVAHYGYGRNWLYLLQRWSGVVAFGYLLYHSWDTSINKRIIEASLGHVAGHESISYAAMAFRFAQPWYLALYVVGIVACAFHLGNGVFNFSIRWGIAIGKTAQRVAAALGWMIGVGLTVLGIAIAVNFYVAGRNYANNGAIEKQYTSVRQIAETMAERKEATGQAEREDAAGAAAGAGNQVPGL